MAAKKDSNEKSKKRKYKAPKIERHGALQSIAERVTGSISLCCLSRRAEKALRSSVQKQRLADDVARALE